MPEHRVTDRSLQLRALANVALELLDHADAAGDGKGALRPPDLIKPDIPDSMLRALLRYAIPVLIAAGHSTLVRDIEAALDASEPPDGE